MITTVGLSCGLAYGGASVLGWTYGIEGPVAIGLLGLCGLIVGLRIGDAGRAGLMTGFLAGLVAVWLQALLLPVYLANNPAYADVPIPFGWDARVATFVLGPLNAVVAGLIVGAAAWAVSRWRRRA